VTERHIVAMGGGQDVGDPVFRYASDLVDRPRPKVCLVPTAASAVPISVMRFLSVFPADRFEPTYLDLFNRDDRDLRDFVCSQDLIFVGGGNTANLLAVWRVHGLDEIFRRVWEAGIVLAGVSAGSICWHAGGTTDSFGPGLRAVTNGLALLPYGNGVHYDSEARRRPLVHRLVTEGVLPLTYCTDDGVGLVYRGTELAEAVSERPGAGAYVVGRDERGAAVEERIEPRRLPGA